MGAYESTFNRAKKTFKGQVSPVQHASGVPDNVLSSSL